ncbi:MAG: tyrosine-type recombinase/integrase [Rhodanobacter sp.]
MCCWKNSSITATTCRPLMRWHAPLDVDSVGPILRRAFAQAGLTQAAAYSGHSMRRGFANWANANGWDIKSLMVYVGWRKIDTAMRYVDASVPFLPTCTTAPPTKPAVMPALPPTSNATFVAHDRVIASVPDGVLVVDDGIHHE